MRTNAESFSENSPNNITRQANDALDVGFLRTFWVTAKGATTDDQLQFPLLAKATQISAKAHMIEPDRNVKLTCVTWQ